MLKNVAFFHAADFTLKLADLNYCLALIYIGIFTLE